jgi:hypothetical protein
VTAGAICKWWSRRKWRFINLPESPNRFMLEEVVEEQELYWW